MNATREEVAYRQVNDKHIGGGPQPLKPVSEWPIKKYETSSKNGLLHLLLIPTIYLEKT